ncbi:MAG TPA: class I SAM-dependent methyltransferase [Candidatus Angelobacter sp.]
MNERIEALLKVRSEMEVWSTFDRANLNFYITTFRRLHGEGKSILEVGSGYGFTSLLFALLGAREVQGIELIPEAFRRSLEIKAAFDPTLPVHFTAGDAANGLPYPDSSFDCLTLVEVISHVVCADFKAFMAEMARVLKPGGILFISDGNNARSPIRRKFNQDIWNRFENGPPTAPGETVHGHSVINPFSDSRKKIAAAAVPTLTPEECEMIARGTFCFSDEQVETAARWYAESHQAPASFYRPGVCPIEPIQHIYIEQLFDPIALREMLKEIRLQTELITTRRRLPLQKFWDAWPRLTMLAANGFVLQARKIH